MNNNYQVGIYLRLSKEDERLGESGSITNQRAILMNYIKEHNLTFIKEYIDDGILDGLGWDFFIEFNNKQFEIRGYEKFPEEVLKVLNILKNISETYLEEIVPNKKDIEMIMRYKKSNIAVMKILHKQKIIDKETLKDFIKGYKKYK